MEQELVRLADEYLDADDELQEAVRRFREMKKNLIERMLSIGVNAVRYRLGLFERAPAQPKFTMRTLLAAKERMVNEQGDAATQDEMNRILTRFIALAGENRDRPEASNYMLRRIRGTLYNADHLRTL